MTDTFDRTQLDGKDREQLSEIASALGVKAISRMRKADLVEAIVSATSGSNGSGATASESRPRKIRSTVSGGDDLASLAAEEDALATGSEPVDEMTLIRPRRSTSSGNGAVETASGPAASTTDTGERTSTEHRPAESREEQTSDSASSDSDGGQSAHDLQGSQYQSGAPSQVRDDDGQGNRRRRRRRGRERERPGGERQGGERQGGDRGEPRESREEFSGELIALEGLLDLRDE